MVVFCQYNFEDWISLYLYLSERLEGCFTHMQNASFSMISTLFYFSKELSLGTSSIHDDESAIALDKLTLRGKALSGVQLNYTVGCKCNWMRCII